MIARIFLLWILFSLTTSFFWDDEEKQLRQLHQNGEAALQKGDYEAAQNVFEELLSRIVINTTKNSSQKYAVDWVTYVDVAICLATCHEELNQKSEAEKILTQLLAKRPPAEFMPRIKLMKARLSAIQQSPVTAYAEMTTIASKYPKEQWSTKDCSFFHALEESLNDHYDALIAKAKRYLLAGIYSEAISMYEEILSAIETGSYPKVKTQDALIVKKIKYRLAECHFLAADYEKSLALCQEAESRTSDTRLDREMLYLSAQVYREKKEYEKALEMLHNYTHLADRGELDHYDHALFEIGYHYYQNGQTAKARRYFERLQQFKLKPSHVAALYLARIYLDDEKPKEVEALLGHVCQEISLKDPLRYECYYLRALAAYALDDFASAKELFERSLEDRQAAWWCNSTYHLGWCHVRLGDDPLKAEAVRRRFFKSAEDNFKKILDDEAACLSLGQLYLIHFRHFHEEEMLSLLEDLLQEKAKFFSTEALLQALLLRAEAKSKYELKEELYAEATQEKFRQSPSYSQAWYCRGINYFQAGLQNPLHGANFFELATMALEKAFRWTEKGDEQKAAHILKLEAKANIYRNSFITSLSLLEKLLSQFDESVEEREETLYLRGLLASHLTDLSYFPLAEESFQLIINSYPNGVYKEDALYSLATLYYRCENYEKAKQTFIKLASERPSSSFAAEAWFWAAEAALRLKENPGPYLCRIYENYPESELAPEAYFHQFPYKAYLEGTSDALAHLKQFSERFSSSPLQIAASYLIGIHEEEPESAKSAFKKSLAEFSRLQQKGYALESAHVYFRYQALLQLAEVYFNSHAEHDLAKCEQLLLTLVADFSQKEHPLTSLLKQASAYPSQFEEGEFKLAELYLKQGRDYHAQRIFTQMLSHYSSAGIQEGPLLSQVWQEMGKLALKCGDYETALSCFTLSQECGTRFFSDEQKLTLWLLQSDAFRGKKEYDTAMRLLSRVINAETASPLRIKAMYMRAEIYELEGRRELAIRQLEATAKKGGEWALSAQKRLRNFYGYE